MEIGPNEVFAKMQQRAQAEPLVAEILRSCALEAAVDQLREQNEDVKEEDPEASEG